MSGISRRKVLIGAGALAAAAAASPILAACQPSKTGSGKVVVMTDPNEFNDDDLAPANNFYKWDGKAIGTGDLYGMVKDWSPDFTLYAYTKAFDDAGVKVPSDTTPLTYDELRDVAKKVNKKDAGKRVYWGFVHSNNDGWIDRTAMNMLAEKNQTLYSADFS